jgi:Cu(I)/Ag(I) efflux system membrane fusion protein/cobalt-zinc-cadmium efflux system membrane fusion protein
MELTPLAAVEGHESNVVTIDPVMVQNMGVRVAEVVEGELRQDVRVVGYLQETDSARRDINLRVSGWIEKLHADAEGVSVQKGQPLFELYSPELQVAIDELIAARKSLEALPQGTDAQARQTMHTLYDAARRKLELWGLLAEQVESFSKLSKAPATVPIVSPIDGHVTQKNVYAGSAVKAGDLVLRLSDFSSMWLDAQVFERQLPLVKVGQKVKATVESQPGRVYEGEVTFLHPHIDPTTRTALVRITLANKDHSLRQGMYATVEVLVAPAAPGPLVPREAVLDTGTRRVAFISLGHGRFEPRNLKLGLTGDEGLVQVLDGLSAGDQVVTSGQFLIDSESRLKEAVQKHLHGGLAASAKAGGASSAAPKERLKVPHIDDVAEAYLELSRTLGARQEQQKSVSVEKLIGAVKLAAEHGEGEGRTLAEKLLKATEAMAVTDPEDQRKRFAAVSAATIELVERAAPSKKVAAELVVAHCSMTPGGGADWIQAGREIANPYYATAMKSCGEVKRTIATAE